MPIDHQLMKSSSKEFSCFYFHILQLRLPEDDVTGTAVAMRVVSRAKEEALSLSQLTECGSRCRQEEEEAEE